MINEISHEIGVRQYKFHQKNQGGSNRFELNVLIRKTANWQARKFTKVSPQT